MRKAVEKTTRTIKRSLSFEGSGETFSVEIALENVPTYIERDTIIQFLDTLFKEAKEIVR
nr:hypothetical protein [uncultured Acetatifactor sp.]